MSQPPNGQMALFTPPTPELLTEMTVQSQEILDKDQAHQRLNSEFALARQNGTPLSVITADLNALKAVNDELGHDDGDSLIDMVQTIIDVVPNTLRTKGNNDTRPSDIVSAGAIDYSAFESSEGMDKGSTAGRIGGDEFIIILPETDEEGARSVAERIHKAIDERLAGSDGDKFRARGINVGLSLGAAALQPDMTTSSDLLRIADERMYLDKMSQVRPLTEEQIDHLRAGLEHLSKAEIRPRDLPRYIEWLGQKGLELALSTASEDTKLV